MYQSGNRHGEIRAVPERNVRLYNIDDEWWFAIRHGADQGPYPTEDSARQAVIDYINDQFEFEKHLQYKCADPDLANYANKMQIQLQTEIN
jgi:hypothetical protein